MFSPKAQAVMDHVDALRHKVDDHWQIPRDEAHVLAQIVRIGRCRSAVEIGVSYGFSTLHLTAALAEVGGHLHAVERDERKVRLASEHLTQAGLIGSVTIHHGDALDVLGKLAPAEPIDFVFIDASKDQSVRYLELLQGKLASRCILAADNTGNQSQRMKPYVDHVRALVHATSCDVPVGNGFELTILKS